MPNLAGATFDLLHLVDELVLAFLAFLIARGLLSFIDRMVAGVMFRMSGYRVGDRIGLDEKEVIITRIGMTQTTFLLDYNGSADRQSFRVIDNLSLRHAKMHTLHFRPRTKDVIEVRKVD